MGFDSFEQVKQLFDIDIGMMIDEIMPMFYKEIIELNQIEQLSEGVDATGQQIKTISAEERGKGVYSDLYAADRLSAGLRADKVDLKFHGDFWKTFKVRMVTGGWEVIADWIKGGDEDIRDNFKDSYDFLGLIDINIENLVYMSILPELRKRLLNKLGL